MLIFCALILATTVVYETEAIGGCQSYHKHDCVLEGKAIDNCPHQNRWTFQENSKSCVRAAWSDHCDPPQEDYKSNMFTSERECYSQCTGVS